MPYLSPVLTDAELAKLLRISVERFREIRADLEEMGFPKPLQPIDRWLRAQVERWISDQADKDTWWGSLKRWVPDDPDGR